MSRVLLVCGGTGGHLAPGIALAQRLTEEGHECLLMVSRKTVDARMTENYPRLKFIAGGGRGWGSGITNKILFFPALFGAIVSAWRLIGSFNADTVVCFGGFMSLGPAMAAWLRRRPVMVHEANRKTGKAVRLIARFATAVHLPPGVRILGIPESRQHDSGYPVRQEVRPVARETARRTLGFPSTGKLLLIAGGSQGARKLTQWVESAWPELASRGVHVLCLTGPSGREDELRQGGAVLKFLPFSHQMGQVYSAADLAVTRAGAGTLAELASCRTPAILVPLPLAAEDHQTANAVALAQTGAAILLPERDLEQLTSQVLKTILDNATLSAMRDELALADAQNRWEDLAQETITLARAFRPQPA
jgi:UDP-N-acetylglucosamine--N-acetylmuramyl-(pentapeptide) pyrophosphoryl-undecaprenol N-acetylglucosamine transferase